MDNRIENRGLSGLSPIGLRSYFLAAIFVSLMLFFNPLFADESYGLKEDKLGSTLAEFQKRHEGDRSCVLDVSVWTPVGPAKTGLTQCKTTIAGVQAWVTFWFLQENPMPQQAKLWQIFTVLKKETFDDLKAAFIVKYGKPTNEDASIRSSVYWENKTSSIFVIKDFDSVVVTYEHKVLGQLHEKAKKQQAKEKAKDL
jgi:hypothetical protein